MRATMRPVGAWKERPKRTKPTSRTTATMTAGHFESSPSTMKRPSAIAIATPIETQRSWSQRLVRGLPCSIAGAPSWSRNPGIDKTLAGRGQPTASVPGGLLGGGLSCVAVVEESVDGRAGSGDVRAKRAEPEEGLRRRAPGEVVEREGREVARPPDRRECVFQGGGARLEAGGAGARVEGREDGAGGLLRRAGRDPEQDGVVVRELERGQVRPGPAPELGPVGEADGDVGAEPRGEDMEPLRRERGRERLVREDERSGRVRAATAEPGRNGDLLVDRDLPARLDGGVRREQLERGADERVLREAVHGELPGRCELQAVRQLEADEDGDELVVAVGAERAGDEREVELRVGEADAHASASRRRGNSSGASASARVSAPWPSVASAATVCARGAAPASSSAFARVFRRWPNAAPTSVRSSPNRAGSGRRRNATSAESTFGRGRKTSRETGWKPVRSVASWSRTETAPYAFVRGAAKKRSATSRCTITHHCSTDGRPARLSATSGVATLYGRFATSLRGGGTSAARSTRSASPKTTSTFVRAPRRSRRTGSSERSSSTAWTCATRSARNAVRMPGPGPISRTVSSADRSASRSMTRTMFSSTRKCWPSSFFG